MCVIVHKNPGIKLKREVYENCFKNNDDGAGIAYVKDKKLVVNKGFFDFDEFYKTEIEPNEELELLIHFRVASPGMVVSAENCHPFTFSSTSFDNKFQFAVVHNGRIDYKVKPGSSDTACFTDDVLSKHMDRDPFFLENPLGRWMLFRIVNPMEHNRNKIAVMRYDVENDKVSVNIVGECLGVKAHGCWFSNDSYLPPPPKINVGQGMFPYHDYDDTKWTAQYCHKQVKGKWEPYFVWSALVKKERELIQSSTPPLVEGWSSMTLYQQDQVLMFRLGFDSVKEDPTKKKPLAILELAGVNSDGVNIGKVKKHDAKMKWLTKAQRQQIRRVALAYCKAAEGIDIEQWTWNQMIDWMRQDFRETEQVCASMGVAALDKFILACDDHDPAQWSVNNDEDKRKISNANKLDEPEGFGVGMHSMGAFD